MLPIEGKQVHLSTNHRPVLYIWDKGNSWTWRSYWTRGLGLCLPFLFVSPRCIRLITSGAVQIWTICLFSVVNQPRTACTEWGFHLLLIAEETLQPGSVSLSATRCQVEMTLPGKFSSLCSCQGQGKYWYGHLHTHIIKQMTGKFSLNRTVSKLQCPSVCLCHFFA